MNKSNLFKAAHILAKSVIKAGDNYRVTFGAALRTISKTIIDRDMRGLKIESIKIDGVFANVYLKVRIAGVTAKDLPKELLNISIDSFFKPAMFGKAGHADLTLVLDCDKTNPYNSDVIKNMPQAIEYMQQIMVMQAA